MRRFLPLLALLAACTTSDAEPEERVVADGPLVRVILEQRGNVEAREAGGTLVGLYRLRFEAVRPEEAPLDFLETRTFVDEDGDERWAERAGGEKLYSHTRADYQGTTFVEEDSLLPVFVPTDAALLLQYTVRAGGEEQSATVRLF